MNVEQKALLPKHCANCTLPATFPGIRFDDRGVCNYCLDFKGKEFLKAEKARYSQKFEALIKENRSKSIYDVLMCYSGGKDSTYTLAVLKERYHLNPLAVTFDNGFIANQALTNIYNVVEKLGVDHIMFKPRFDVLAKIFRYCSNTCVYPLKALERSSAICTSCMGMIRYSSLRLALEKRIPFIAYGWSPGQAPVSSSVMKNIPSMIKRMQKIIYDPLFKIAGREIDPYFLDDKHFNGSYQFPYNLNPLAFIDYNLEAIHESISRFGWKRPEEVDANSTNCLLNSYAVYIHKKQLGFHPYAFELANLVREGNLSRATALQRLETPEDPYIVELVRDKLEGV